VDVTRRNCRPSVLWAGVSRGEKWVAIRPTVAHTRVMVVVLILLGLLIAAGIASICGWTVDTRDPEYSMGRLIPPDATNPPSNR
jgi:hypothetical protein